MLNPGALPWLLTILKNYPHREPEPRRGLLYTVTQHDAIQYLCQKARISWLLALSLFYELPECCVCVAVMLKICTCPTLAGRFALWWAPSSEPSPSNQPCRDTAKPSQAATPAQCTDIVLVQILLLEIVKAGCIEGWCITQCPVHFVHGELSTSSRWAAFHVISSNFTYFK